MPVAAASSQGNNAIAHLRNNTAKWWFQDAGLRKLAVAIGVGFCSPINNGYDGSLMNGLQAMPRFMNAIGNPDANKLGIISAAYSLGGIPALPLGSWLSDKYGRRPVISIGAILIIVGSLVQTFTRGGDAMLAGRFVVGMGSSFQGIGGGAYTTEICHPRNRAQTTALINTCWYIGSIIAAWTTFGALNIQSEWCWKLCTLIQAVPCTIQLFIIWFMPESPRFLVATGKEEQAYQILKKYHANGVDDDELVLFEFDEIKEAIRNEKQAAAGTSYASFIRTKGNRHRLLILICVGFFSQWVGNGIISYYLTRILESVGVTNPTQQAGLNGGLQIFNWIAAIGGALACERLGRRFLWLASAVGMLVTFICITACSAVYAKTENPAAGRAVIALLFLYFGSYDIAFTGLTLAYPLEILPFSLRTQGIAIFNFVVSCALFFNQYVNPIALEKLAWKYYFVYIGMLLFAILMIWNFYPETRGRTLEEVAEIFDGADAALHATGETHLAPSIDDAQSFSEKKADLSIEHVELRK